jgi:glycosyltransferase involved in cell wall biosynthesis
MTAEIARRIASRDYDVVLDVSANMLLNVPDCPLPVPLVVDSIDEPLLRDLRALRTVAWRDRAWLAYRAWMFWCYERALLGAATQNIYASELDAATYRRFFPNRPAAVVPNGVDIRYFSPADDRTDPSTIIFEGNMMFGANVDAARHLVHNVLPRLLRRVPDARIVLVGRDPAPQVQALASDRVAVTGTVADIRPYLARATVFACPMRLGSGIKNKILQAWAMARPVVTSTAGLGGLAARDGDNVLVRDAPDDFAAALACVIEDGDLAARLGKAGRNTVEREYSWEYRAAQFERLLQDAVQSHGTRVVGRDAPVAAPGSPAKSAPRMTPHV